MKPRRPFTTLAAVLVSTSLLALIFSGSASALVREHFFEELTPTEQEAATDFFYEQSPQATVPYSGEAEELSESMSHTYESQSESQPFYEELAGDVNEVGQGDELFPPVEDAVPEIWAANGAFSVGWKIGEGARSLFADIGLNIGSAPEETFLGAEGYEFCYSSECDGSLQWMPYGEDLYIDATVQQEPGAYLYDGHLQRYGGFNEGQRHPITWRDSPCSFSDFSPPPYAQLQTGVDSGAQCFNGELYESYVDYPYVTLKQLLSLEHFHPYDALLDGTSYVPSKAPEDPGTATVEEAVAEEVDKSEFDQSWVTQAQEPEPGYEYFPAPTATEREVGEEDRKCERGGPIFTNIEGNDSPEPFVKREASAFTIADVPESEAGSAPVYLRYGETHWNKSKGEEPEYIDNWGGWGYRHIAAKHGWGPLDRLETEEALATAMPETTGRGTWLYESLDSTPGEGGVECTRRVIVDFVHKEGNPAPRGIVSSYNVAGKPAE